ncbi:nuclease [Laetiporus sulphureus 93-53]|uniref:Nuclease n=1 Tax=Laetiporus sulphureus 93-53 TaxID=1314785 RepID=A0A165DJN3_9APHY|nr:nuclease [Laetiporus sulphureus 93-53]KZT05030.1 nuclease [Laetiporus sulphureus 93-53]
MLAFAAFCLGSASTLGGVYVYRRHFKRILNADWVTPDVLRRKRLIKGLVTSVGDADNFRIYHTPGFGWRWPLKYRFVPSRAKDLKDQTIHIRIAGVDAPEGAHFGRPAQAFAEESLTWLKKQIEGKMVYCQLLRRDQYGRIVATVYLKPRILPSSLFLGKPLALEMLRAGWVEVYELSGAEYGRWGKEEFLRIQAEAQYAMSSAARRGMWKHGTDGESPADYKRRYASSSSDAEKASSTRRAASTDGNGQHTKGNVVDAAKDASWVRRLFWRIRG